MTNSMKQQPAALVIALALLLGSTPISSIDITNGLEGRIHPSYSALSNEPEVGQSSRTMRERLSSLMKLPGSPADLFHPDKFQFYTLDQSGQVVTKEMTRQEIQSLIAAGGGHLPAMPTVTVDQQPQKAGEVPSSGTKVADVIQNVQNVLKSQLNRPVPTMIAPPPTIPGHANSEWSNILPSILAAGDVDNHSTQQVIKSDVTEISSSNHKSQDNDNDNNITERPMIQVPVITVEEKLPMENSPSLNSQVGHGGIKNETKNQLIKPVFQIMNTISAETLKTTYNDTMIKFNRPEMGQPAASINSVSTMAVDGDDHQSTIKNLTYVNKNKESGISTNSINDLGVLKPVLFNNDILINENTSSTPFPVLITDDSVHSTTSSVENRLATTEKPINQLVITAQREHDTANAEPSGTSPSPQAQSTEATTPMPLVTSSTTTAPLSTSVVNDNNVTESGLISELENSLSSMISQISQSNSEPLHIKSNSNDRVSTSNDGLFNGTIGHETNEESKIVSGAVNSDETPIVRIDIMEVKSSPTSETDPLKLNISQNSNDESPVVRIQLATNSNSDISHLIESLTSNSNNNHGFPTRLPEIAPLNLPSRHNIHANNVTSGLIAGFSDNNDDNATTTKQTAKLPDDADNLDSIDKYFLNEDNYNISNMLMQKINFDQLPIINQQSMHKPGDVNLLIMKDNDSSITGMQLNHNSASTSNVVDQINKYSTSTRVDLNDKKEDNIETILLPEEHEENSDAGISQLASHIFIPPKIQLDDLPIVEKMNKYVDMNIRNSTTKGTPNSLIDNLYRNDPYKKLGETKKPLGKLEEMNILQTTLNNNSNKTLKIKDQKKDSSMEIVPLIDSQKKNSINILNDFSGNQSSVMAERKPTREPGSVFSNGSRPIGGDDYSTNDNRKNISEGLEKWTLIPQQLPDNAPPKIGMHSKRPINTTIKEDSIRNNYPVKNQPQKTSALLNNSRTVDGLDSSVKDLEPDISYFSNICNDLAFSLWNATNEGLSVSRSLVISPFGLTSMLAMIFLGARGTTSDQMNNILKLDDVASFNPHLIFQNVTDSVGLGRKQGIANAAFVRELFADKMKVRKLLPFYKEQAQQFYDGVVAEVNFATISDLARRRTNLMIRKQTGGRIKDFARSNIVPLRSPLAALSANVYQTDCNSSDASSDGRDGELYFAVSPAVRQRKLVPVPSTVWRSGVLAGYEPSLDATAIALGGPDKLVSTIFVIPGQQGFTAPGDSLELLEERLIRRATYDGLWNKLLKVIIPRPEFELQVPKFSHRSVINATAALKKIGMQQLFDNHADLKGINGIGSDLHLTDVLQMNLFSTCGDENILSGRHHVEIYPTNSPRDIRTVAHQLNKIPFNNKDKMSDQSSTVKLTSTKINQDVDKPRLKLDRPFLYFVRHNPTGLILHMGRFNPRLLP